jgi:hypothetical protein
MKERRTAQGERNIDTYELSVMSYEPIKQA